MKGKLSDNLKYIIFSFLCVFLIGGIFIFTVNTVITNAQREKDTPINDNHYTAKEAVSQENSESIVMNSSSDSKNIPIYTVKEYEGIIGIFNFGENTPIITENKRINTLPEKDRSIILEGRDFYSYREMMEFLMDYE